MQPETSALASLRREWTIADDVTYLNHGSFGPSPRIVQEARAAWTARLERQPMQFFVRDLERELDAAAARLGAFVGADPQDLIFVDNATAGMNIVAANVNLSAGDEVLLTDHEYGAVMRVWRETCRRAGAQLVVRPIGALLRSKGLPAGAGPKGATDEHSATDERATAPSEVETESSTGRTGRETRATETRDLVESFLDEITGHTKLIVVSHITSPTAIILPVAEICRAARERGVPVCIDGPHAVAMVPLDLRQIDCDYYAASCHKWLSAPFGSGFLYVARRRQQGLKPAIMSWGGSISGRPPSWKDEFNWSGTRDPAAYLAVPEAIDFLERHGFENFRRETQGLAAYARHRISEFTGIEPLVPDSRDWYGGMVSLPLPPADVEPQHPAQPDPLQAALWEQHRIEVPVMRWQGRRLLRVSCHLYNDRSDIDRLVAALTALTGGGNPLS